MRRRAGLLGGVAGSVFGSVFGEVFAPNDSDGPSVPSLPAVNTTSLAARWQPDHSTVTKSGSEILTASDLVGSFSLAKVAAFMGAVEMVDTNPTSPCYGRKFWRFYEPSAAQIAQGILAKAMECATLNLSVRNYGCFMVVRQLTGSDPCNFLTMGTTAAPLSTNGPSLCTLTTSGLAPFLKSANQAATASADAATQRAKMIVGSQIQVIGVTSGASSGRLYMNRDYVTLAGAVFNAGTSAGITIGLNAMSTTVKSNFDVFDILVYNATPTNANADIIAGQLQDGYGIYDITDSLIIAGDSIFHSFAGDSNYLYQGTPNDCITGGQWMDITPGFRVINYAVSGDDCAALYAKMTTSNSVFRTSSMLGGALSGHNRIAFQIGTNDLSSRTAANIYNQAAATNTICNIIGSATFGLRLSFDKIFCCVIISTGNTTMQAVNDTLRGLLRSTSTFAIDSGTTFGTNLFLIDLPEITFGSLGGIKVFNTRALAISNGTDTDPAIAIFQSDKLHPTGTVSGGKPGNKYLVKGGAWDGGSGSGLEAAFA